MKLIKIQAYTTIIEIQDNCDRQIILEEKIKNKENKIKLYDLQIKKFKLNIGDMHERIKKARYETLESKEIKNKYKESTANY